VQHRHASPRWRVEAGTVRIDEKEKKNIKRQGEWFFIEFGTSRELKQILLFPIKEIIQKHSYLPIVYQTQEPHHKVTERIDIGRWIFCRGTVRHDNHEHKMLILGKNWFKAFPSTQIISWGGTGTVD